MPLTNFPGKTKYTYLDNVYIWQSEAIESVTVLGWRTIVDDPNGDNTGRQIIYYNFQNKGGLEVEESLVFASENALLFWIKNDDINRAIESGSGADLTFTILSPKADEVPLSFGNWTDFGGFNLAGFNLINDGESPAIDVTLQISQCVFDGTTLNSAKLPAAISSKAAFKAAVKSYDKNTTIWTNNLAIGE